MQKPKTQVKILSVISCKFAVCPILSICLRSIAQFYVKNTLQQPSSEYWVLGLPTGDVERKGPRRIITKLLCAPSLLVLLALGARAQGTFVYTNDGVSTGNTVSGFSVAPDGTLTPIAGSPFSTG